MYWRQKTLQLSPKSRGCHLVMGEILQQLPEIPLFQMGLAHFFIQHTSASLTLNENADTDVPLDLAMSLDRLAPENAPYRHTCEGPDDMPAHVKASLMGSSLSIPIQSGKLMLGTWQGIYLNEHRNHAGSRSLFVSLYGISRDGDRPT